MSHRQIRMEVETGALRRSRKRDRSTGGLEDEEQQVSVASRPRRRSSSAAAGGGAAARKRARVVQQEQEEDDDDAMEVANEEGQDDGVPMDESDNEGEQTQSQGQSAPILTSSPAAAPAPARASSAAAGGAGAAAAAGARAAPTLRSIFARASSSSSSSSVALIARSAGSPVPARSGLPSSMVEAPPGLKGAGGRRRSSSSSNGRGQGSSSPAFPSPSDWQGGQGRRSSKRVAAKAAATQGSSAPSSPRPAKRLEKEEEEGKEEEEAKKDEKKGGDEEEKEQEAAPAAGAGAAWTWVGGWMPWVLLGLAVLGLGLKWLWQRWLESDAFVDGMDQTFKIVCAVVMAAVGGLIYWVGRPLVGEEDPAQTPLSPPPVARQRIQKRLGSKLAERAAAVARKWFPSADERAEENETAPRWEEEEDESVEFQFTGEGAREEEEEEDARKRRRESAMSHGNEKSGARSRGAKVAVYAVFLCMAAAALWGAGVFPFQRSGGVDKPRPAALDLAVEAAIPAAMIRVRAAAGATYCGEEGLEATVEALRPMVQRAAGRVVAAREAKEEGPARTREMKERVQREKVRGCVWFCVCVVLWGMEEEVDGGGPGSDRCSCDHVQSSHLGQSAMCRRPKPRRRRSARP